MSKSEPHEYKQPEGENVVCCSERYYGVCPHHGASEWVLRNCQYELNQEQQRVRELEQVIAINSNTIEANERLKRLESMVAFMLGKTEEDIVTTPTTEQAKQLHALGLPPWPRIRRATNRFELWKEGYEKIIKDRTPPPQGGSTNEKPEA